MNQQAEEYINTRLHGEPYISVHLRMGSDWVRGYNTAADREFITYVEDTSQALCCEQGVIAPMLIESLSYVEDTPLALCCEQGVIAPMLIESLSHI